MANVSWSLDLEEEGSGDRAWKGSVMESVAFAIAFLYLFGYAESAWAGVHRAIEIVMGRRRTP